MTNNKFRMIKYIIFLLLIVVSTGCSGEKTETVKLGADCETWFDCNEGELCIDKHCKALEKHLCPKNECPKDMACNTITQYCEAEECSTHSDCAELNGVKRFCDNRTGYCASNCFSDAACGDKYSCNNTGQCELKAEENCTTKGCSDNEKCDTVTGLCEPVVQTGCSDNQECYPQLCNLGTGLCEDDPMYCTGQGTCPQNHECDIPSNRCKMIGGDSCEDDLECGTEFCDPELHVCVQCLNDEHCTGGTCDLGSKRCFVEQHCQNDGECPDGTKCISENGVFSGGDGFPGMPGQENTTGTCKEYTPCYVDTDCPELDGKEQLCKDATEGNPGYCAKKKGNGFEDILEGLGICDDRFLPCPDNQVCIKQDGELAGTCYAEGNEPECTNDNECPALHPDETSPMICQRGSCTVDPTPRCSQESDCETETMHNMHCDTGEGVCYSCVTDEHCGDGSTCSNHNCVNSSFCNGPSDCPDGMSCRANMCSAD